jgi:hypothetical protein
MEKAINPYKAPTAAHDDSAPPGWLKASLAFMIVLTVAIIAGGIAPTVAHLAGAPTAFTTELLRISMLSCVPFGLAVAYSTGRCVRHRLRISQLCWFFAVLLIVLPLAAYSKTAGPLVGYTGFAILLTVVAGLVVAALMRRAPA